MQGSLEEEEEDDGQYVLFLLQEINMTGNSGKFIFISERERDQYMESPASPTLSCVQRNWAIDSAEQAMSTLKEGIAALEGGIKALDKFGMEATEQRKQEHKGVQ